MPFSNWSILPAGGCIDIFSWAGGGIINFSCPIGKAAGGRITNSSFFSQEVKTTGGRKSFMGVLGVGFL